MKQAMVTAADQQHSIVKGMLDAARNRSETVVDFGLQTLVSGDLTVMVHHFLFAPEIQVCLKHCHAAGY